MTGRGEKAWQAYASTAAPAWEPLHGRHRARVAHASPRYRGAGPQAGAPDSLLAEVRVPLLAVAAAVQLRRTWLLQPASARSSTGAGDVELALSWMPLPLP